MTQKCETPQDIVTRQQATLRELAAMLTRMADAQVDSIFNFKEATWGEVSEFAMQAEMAQDMINSFVESGC